ncbi:MAG: hypothetical protein GXP04_08380 [Alphaproteobacteria bacterium]|nr:hypothetical protein [Alphaproteobacteria bacterium]
MTQKTTNTADLTRHQKKLLAFERAQKAMALIGGGLIATAAAAQAEIGEQVVDPAVLADWQEKMVALQASTVQIHSAFETKALEVGAHMVTGGSGKSDPPAVAQAFLSALGLS